MAQPAQLWRQDATSRPEFYDLDLAPARSGIEVTMTGRNEGLPLESLWEAPEPSTAPLDRRGGPPPPALANRYPGQLTIDLREDRPTIVANFVSSLDGVVATSAGVAGAGGGEISGFSEADRLMMALLRGLADAIVVGAGTVRLGRRHVWTAAHLQPTLADEFAAWRAGMGLRPQPTTIVVTASGDLDGAHAGLNTPDVPVIVATTKAGAHRLSTLPLSPNVRVEVVGDEARIPARAILEVIRGTGARLALCEGGPHLFGALLTARLVEGTSFGEGRGRWASLAAVRRAGDDLFLRYRFEP
jgi:riboflavin biosynthesis pyrimidine reductase